ncbi:MAG: arsenate reductase ArsC, partial [Planctomycetota bacterium]
GYVHPLALAALAELELPVGGLTSKHLDSIDLSTVDLAVTVCDNAKESCPTLPAHIEILHWPFDDPADATGNDEQKLHLFRRVRDEILVRIQSYLRGLDSE